MAVQSGRTTGLEQLRIPQGVRDDLGQFIGQLIGFYKEDLVSIVAFGSAVSGDYADKTSDVNLLVVYSDLNIADPKAVTKLAQRWLEKRNFVPRFLSKRNLVDSAKYFQIDLMEMRDAHVVLYGEDVLAQLPVSLLDMRWQLAHEIKSMRMRVKQQFWRAAGNERTMRIILLQRFSSLIHLMRALLSLKNKPTRPSHREVIQAAERELGIDRQFAQRLFEVKAGQARIGREELVQSFDKLMEMIRTIDRHVDQLAD